MFERWGQWAYKLQSAGLEWNACVIQCKHFKLWWEKSSLGLRKLAFSHGLDPELPFASPVTGRSGMADERQALSASSRAIASAVIRGAA